MSPLNTPDSQAKVQYVGIKDALRYIEGEYLQYTYDQGVRNSSGGRIQWPYRDVFVIHMAGLPSDCGELITRIYEMFAAVDAEGFVKFPVASIEIRHDDDLVCIYGDAGRIDEMHPMP